MVDHLNVVRVEALGTLFNDSLKRNNSINIF